MNIRLQKYKANRLAGMSQYQSAIKAGYKHSYASDHSKDLEDSAKLGMSRAFAMLGITDLALAQKAIAGLQATKRYGKDGDVEDMDWATIHKFYETICTMSGRLVKNPINLDLSQHEHFTVQVVRAESIINADQRDHSQLQSDAQTDNSVRSISLT